MSKFKGNIFKQDDILPVTINIGEISSGIAENVKVTIIVNEGNVIVSENTLSTGTFNVIDSVTYEWIVGTLSNSSQSATLDVTVQDNDTNCIQLSTSAETSTSEINLSNNDAIVTWEGISYNTLSSYNVEYSITEAFTGRQDDNNDDIYVQGFTFISSDVVQVAAALEVSIVSPWQPSDFKRVIRHEIEYDYIAAQGIGVQTNPDIRHTTFSGANVPEYRIVTGPINTGGHWYIYYTKNP